MLKRLLLINKSNNLMLNPRELLTLAFNKILYDKSRKNGQSCSFCPRPLHQGKKAPQRVIYLVYVFS